MYKYNSVKDIGINFQTAQMDLDQTETFINLMTLIKIQNKNIDIIMNNLAESPSVFAIVDKRYKALNLQDRIDRNVLLFVELFAEGSPGIGVFMLIELLNLAETLQKKVDCNDFSRLYPNGFFTKESVIQIVDGYVKTGLLRNSEIY